MASCCEALRGRGIVMDRIVPAPPALRPPAQLAQLEVGCGIYRQAGCSWISGMAALVASQRDPVLRAFYQRHLAHSRLGGRRLHHCPVQPRCYDTHQQSQQRRSTAAARTREPESAGGHTNYASQNHDDDVVDHQRPEPPPERGKGASRNGRVGNDRCVRCALRIRCVHGNPIFVFVCPSLADVRSSCIRTQGAAIGRKVLWCPPDSAYRTGVLRPWHARCIFK